MQAPIASPVMRHNAVVTPFRPKQPQPLRIIAMGDSVIYGYGDLSGGGWVERLRRQWMAPDSAGHVIYNLGVRGDKVAQVSDRLELEFRSRGELRNRLPTFPVTEIIAVSRQLYGCFVSRQNFCERVISQSV